MPQSRQWFRLPNHINSSAPVRALNLCRAGDAGLGNRRTNEHGHQFKACPLCSKRGATHKLNEEHVVKVCPSMSFERDSLGISAYLNVSRTCPPSYTRLYKNYLGGGQCPNGYDDLTGRGHPNTFVSMDKAGRQLNLGTSKDPPSDHG